MTHLGISFVSGLSTLVKYLSVSRLRLIRNTQALNALARDFLSGCETRERYLQCQYLLPIYEGSTLVETV